MIPVPYSRMLNLCSDHRDFGLVQGVESVDEQRGVWYGTGC
jgi:hypothetical protein